MDTKPIRNKNRFAIASIRKVWTLSQSRYIAIHGFTDSVLVCKMQFLLGYGKNLRNFSFLSKQYKAISVCWYKQSTSKSFLTCLYCIYLFKLYYKSIIILLTNNLNDIRSEVSKIWLVLWMVYTCNVKRPEKVENFGRNECTLHYRTRSLKMSDYIRPYQ